MSQQSARYTTEEIVASIKIGVGVSLSDPPPFWFEDIPELHNRFPFGLLVTIEMLLGRLEDIHNQVVPEYHLSGKKDNNQHIFMLLQM